MCKQFIEAWASFLLVSWFEPSGAVWRIALILASLAAIIQTIGYGWLVWTRRGTRCRETQPDHVVRNVERRGGRKAIIRNRESGENTPHREFAKQS